MLFLLASFLIISAEIKISQILNFLIFFFLISETKVKTSGHTEKSKNSSFQFFAYDFPGSQEGFCGSETPQTQFSKA